MREVCRRTRQILGMIAKKEICKKFKQPLDLFFKVWYPYIMNNDRDEETEGVP